MQIDDPYTLNGYVPPSLEPEREMPQKEHETMPMGLDSIGRLEKPSIGKSQYDQIHDRMTREASVEGSGGTTLSQGNSHIQMPEISDRVSTYRCL